MGSIKHNSLRVLIADDHAMIRSGIRLMLTLPNAYMQFIVDEAESSEEAVARCEEQVYDVVLMDYYLPGRGGPKATQLIRQRAPGTHVLGLSSYDERGYVEAMMEAGAQGYILKSVGVDTLVTAIRTVAQGRVYYSNEIALKLMQAKIPGSSHESLDLLTAREREVFRMVLDGLRDGEIAARLYRSPRTIEKHRQNLMNKLGVHNILGLLQMGVRMGLVRVPGRK